MLTYETKARSQGYGWIVGVDEAGRGPLAGPVVASAVILKSPKFKCLIQDSKKMTPFQRELAFEEIQHKAFVGIGVMNEAVIDEINILQATFAAMGQAITQLRRRVWREEGINAFSPEKVMLLIDGHMFRSDLPYQYRPIVDGDNLSLSIACASIMAKVYRDRLITIYDRIFPQYGFKQHKGYATVSHREAIARHGFCMIHRRSFQHKLV